MCCVDVAKSRVHFVGIGGIGMSGIARMLVEQPNLIITGSESKDSDIVKQLQNLGVCVYLGHAPGNVNGADLIVRTSAVKDDNPEIVAAKDLNIPVIHRSEKLACLFNRSRGISVAGTHGKTTTSSMTVVALREAGISPSFIVGGIIDNYGVNAGYGDSGWTVIEADESDGTLVKYKPEIAVVTNIEHDHADHYEGIEDVLEVFRIHVESIRPAGTLVYCAECPKVRSLVENPRKDIDYLSYAIDSDARLKAQALEMKKDGVDFDAVFDGVNLGRVHLSLLGCHNVLNALAVIAVGIKLGLSLEAMLPGLRSFGGAKRRFDVLSHFNDGTPHVVDDYAHHPTEIAATLMSARQAAGNKRVVVAFQPHRYSRTLAFAKKFAEALKTADKVVLAPVYSAGEAPLPGADSSRIAEEMKDLGKTETQLAANLEEVEAALRSDLNMKDALLLVMGAGDIWKVARNLAK